MVKMDEVTISLQFKLDCRHLNMEINNHIQRHLEENFMDKVMDGSFYIKRITSIVVDGIVVGRANGDLIVKVTFKADILKPKVNHWVEGKVVNNLNNKIIVKVEDKLTFCIINQPNNRTVKVGDIVMVRLMDPNHVKCTGKDLLCLGELGPLA